MSLFETYKATYKQGFLPIFVKDNFPAEKLIEGCLKAELAVIEYTLRRESASVDIPKITNTHPDLNVLVGSTLDSADIITDLKHQNKQLMTLPELEGIGVDGFISMFEFSGETIRKYCNSHLLIPAAYTPNEAYRMLKSGAHFIKMMGPDLSLVKKTRMAPSHGFCPIFVTGGMTPEVIPAAIEAGAICIASGFDLLLKNKPETISTDEIADIILNYINTVKQARIKHHPELMERLESDDDSWIELTPHISIKN